jgi:hypothetical protein
MPQSAGVFRSSQAAARGKNADVARFREMSSGGKWRENGANRELLSAISSQGGQLCSPDRPETLIPLIAASPAYSEDSPYTTSAGAVGIPRLVMAVLLLSWSFRHATGWQVIHPATFVIAVGMFAAVVSMLVDVGMAGQPLGVITIFRSPRLKGAGIGTQQFASPFKRHSSRMRVMHLVHDEHQDKARDDITEDNVGVEGALRVYAWVRVGTSIASAIRRQSTKISSSRIS